MLFPKKNLIKPATNSDWALSPYATVLAPYHLKVNQPTQYQASVFSKLDLKPNTLYTLSCEGISDNAQFYVKRMLNGVAAYHILKKGIEVLEFTTVAGATYTIEFHNGITIGEGYVLNFQLEEGKKTPFEPYRLVNKPAVMNTEMLFPDMTGAASHAFVALNVFTVKRNVKLRKAKMNVATTGSFNILVQEWQDGVGLIGNPVYQKDQTLSATGLIEYDFGGVLLEKGKTYAIGRYNQTGAAGVFRTTSAPNPNSNYLTWLGGTTPNNTSIIYPTTYYYFYGMEIESLRENKTANLYNRNLIPPLSDPKWFVKSGHAKGAIINDYEYRMSTAAVSVIGYDIPITLKPNTTYTLGGTFIGGGARLRLMRASDDFFLINLNPSAPVQTYTTTSLTDYKIRVENNGQAGDYTTKDFYLFEGNIPTPIFEPRSSKNKPLSFYPRKNLIPDFKDPRWFSDYTTGGGTMVVDPIDPYKMKLTLTVSAQGRLLWIPVEIGKTYTFSFGKIDGLYRIYKRKVGNHDNAMALIQNGSAGMPLSYTFTPDADYQGFVTIRLTQGAAGTFSFEELKLEEGSDKSARQEYKNNMKPAVLYPQKNLIPPLTDPTWKPYATTTVKGPYSLLLNSTAAWNTSYCVVPVEIGKTYTHSCKITGEGRMEMWQDGANRSTVDGVTSSRTFTAISNTVEVRFVNRNQLVGTMTFDDFQLEEGPVKTPFEPLKLGNKK